MIPTKDRHNQRCGGGEDLMFGYMMNENDIFGQFLHSFTILLLHTTSILFKKNNNKLTSNILATNTCKASYNAKVLQSR